MIVKIESDQPHRGFFEKRVAFDRVVCFLCHGDYSTTQEKNESIEDFYHIEILMSFQPVFASPYFNLNGHL